MNLNIMAEFYEKDVTPLFEFILEKLEKEYKLRKYEWKEQFLSTVDSVFQKLDGQTPLPVEPYFFMIQLLRTRLIQKDYRYIFNIYGEKWFLEEDYLLGNWDVSFIFRYFDELWEELLIKSKRYIMKISSADIECVMLDIVDKFESYIIRLLRESRNDMVELESYQQVKKADLFLIQCGEYYETCKTIHRECREKDEAELIYMLKKKIKKDTYQFGDFRKMNFEGIKLDNLDLLYCDFSGSNMKNIKFEQVLLMGARFVNCDLTNATICDSNLNGVDFRKARLKNTNFENSFLKGTMFTKEQLCEIKLEIKQLNEIIIDD